MPKPIFVIRFGVHLRDMQEDVNRILKPIKKDYHLIILFELTGQVKFELYNSDKEDKNIEVLIKEIEQKCQDKKKYNQKELATR